MNRDATSFLFMFIGLFSALFMIAYQRPGWEKTAAGITAGLFAGLANMFVEYLAAEHKIYFVFGLLPVAHSSLALTIGWMSLAVCFTLGSERLTQYPRPLLALAIYVGFGILAGIFSDYLGEIALGHFKRGPNGNWFYICLAWISLLPATVFIYKILYKAMK